MTTSEAYFNELGKVFEKIRTTQMGAINKAAEVCAEVLKHDGLIYTFGTGHSHLLAEEIFSRAGGLAAVYPILEDPLMLNHAARSSYMERMPGYAKLLLDEVNPIPGSAIFLFSNSGRNTVVIEMAEEARLRGLTVLCITNMTHTMHTTSRAASGKKLYELCDVVIDNCGCIGDSCIEIYGRTSGATSTAAGAAIMQAITCRTVELCEGRAEVFVSSNVDCANNNEKYVAKYRKLVRPL